VREPACLSISHLYTFQAPARPDRASFRVAWAAPRSSCQVLICTRRHRTMRCPQLPASTPPTSPSRLSRIQKRCQWQTTSSGAGWQRPPGSRSKSNGNAAVSLKLSSGSFVYCKVEHARRLATVRDGPCSICMAAACCKYTYQAWRPQIYAHMT